MEADARPEFAHAAGHEVGVFFELGGIGEGDDPVRAGFGEALEIEPLAVDDLAHDGLDFRAIERVELREPIEAGADLREQALLALGSSRARCRAGARRASRAKPPPSIDSKAARCASRSAAGAEALSAMVSLVRASR